MRERLKEPREGSERELKPSAYKESERAFMSVTACLLKNEPTSVCMRQTKSGKDGVIGKPSLNRATTSYAYDPKPGELPMGRVK